MSECASGTPEEGKTSIIFCVSPATILSLSTFIQSLVSVVCQSFTIKSLSQEARGKMGLILEMVCQLAIATVCNSSNNCTLTHALWTIHKRTHEHHDTCCRYTCVPLTLAKVLTR